MNEHEVAVLKATPNLNIAVWVAGHEWFEHRLDPVNAVWHTGGMLDVGIASEPMEHVAVISIAYALKIQGLNIVEFRAHLGPSLVCRRTIPGRRL